MVVAVQVLGMERMVVEAFVMLPMTLNAILPEVCSSHTVNLADCVEVEVVVPKVERPSFAIEKKEYASLVEATVKRGVVVATAPCTVKVENGVEVPMPTLETVEEEMTFC